MPKEKFSLRGEEFIRVPLHKGNLRQLTNFIQTEFPGLNIPDASELAGLSRQRLQYLLMKCGSKTITEYDTKAIFQLYEDLKSGKKTYKPTKVKWEIGERPALPKGIPLCKENLCQLIDFLVDEFSIPKKEITRLAGMNEIRLRALMYNPRYKTIRLQEVEVIFKVCYDLLNKKVTYQSNTSDHYDADNVLKLILFLQKSFPEANLEAISRETGISSWHLQCIAKNQRVKLDNPQGLSNLWNLYDDVKSGKKSFTTSKHSTYGSVGRVELNRANLCQWVDFLKTTFGVSKQKISRSAGFHPNHVSQLLHIRKDKVYGRSKISPLEVDALFRAYETLKDEQNLRESKVKSHLKTIFINPVELRERVQKTYLPPVVVAKYAGITRVTLSRWLKADGSIKVNKKKFMSLDKVLNYFNLDKA